MLTVGLPVFHNRLMTLSNLVDRSDRPDQYLPGMVRLGEDTRDLSNRHQVLSLSCNALATVVEMQGGGHSSKISPSQWKLHWSPGFHQLTTSINGNVDDEHFRPRSSFAEKGQQVTGITAKFLLLLLP